MALAKIRKIAIDLQRFKHNSTNVSWNLAIVGQSILNFKFIEPPGQLKSKIFQMRGV